MPPNPPNVILNRLAPDVVAQQVPIGYRIFKQHEAQVSAPVGRIHQHDDPARLRGGIPPPGTHPIAAVSSSPSIYTARRAALGSAFSRYTLPIVPGYQCVHLLKIAYYSHCIGSVEPRGLSRIFGCPKTGKKGTFFIHNLSVSVKVVIVRVSELFNH